MRWWMLLALVACGRIGFDAAPPESDASIDAPLGMFGQPIMVAALADPAEDDDPTLTGDQLELYFASKRSGDSDIYISTRATTTDEWSTPMRVVELSSQSNDEQPSVSADGLTLFFSSARAPTLGAADIWMSTRTTRESTWSAPIRVLELSSSDEDLGPDPSSNQRRIVLYRYASGQAAVLYESTRPSDTTTFAPPTAIAELDSPQDDMSPFLVGETVLWFASSRPGGSGNRDLWRATRSGTSAPFGPPVVISELNSDSHDDDPWLSADGRTIYFSSERSGNREIYEARR